VRRALLAWLALALLIYALPWLKANSPALELNAYDWAEWLSLHPAERSTAPPLLLTLALRLHLVAWSMLLASALPPRWRWRFVVVLALVAAAQLPPLEFLSSTQDNNYQQQAVLALLSLALGLLARRFLSPDGLWWVMGGIGAIGALLLIISLPQALSRIQDYYPSMALSAAPLALIGLYAGALILAMNHKRSHSAPLAQAAPAL